MSADKKALRRLAALEKRSRKLGISDEEHNDFIAAARAELGIVTPQVKPPPADAPTKRTRASVPVVNHNAVVVDAPLNERLGRFIAKGRTAKDESTLGALPHIPGLTPDMKPPVVVAAEIDDTFAYRPPTRERLDPSAPERSVSPLYADDTRVGVIDPNDFDLPEPIPERRLGIVLTGIGDRYRRRGKRNKSTS